MSSPATSPSPHWPPPAWAFLREELAASPARWRSTLRLTLMCFVGLGLVLFFNLPSGIYFVLFLFVVNMPDAWPSYRKAWIRGLSTFIGGGLALILVPTLAEQPWLLIPVQGAIIAVTLFLSQTTTIPYAMILGGFTFLLIAPNLALDPILYLNDAVCRVVLITLGAILGTLAQLTLWPDDPQRLLFEALAQRLRTVDAILEETRLRPCEPLTRDYHSTFAAQLGAQLDFFASAEARNPNVREHHSQQARIITELERISLSALQFHQAVQSSPEHLTPDLEHRLEAVQRECRRWAAQIGSGERPTELTASPAAASHLDRMLPETPAPDPESPLARLRQLEVSIQRLPAIVSGLDFPKSSASTTTPLDPAGEADRPHPILTPSCSLQNVDAVRYALKGSLAAMICFLVYNGLGWPGISTCVATCVLVAQSTVGAGAGRSFLIFSGALLGGLGSALLVLVAMPNFTDLTAFLVGSGVLLFIAAWVNFGSVRTSYVGIQIMLAMSMVLFVSSGPTFNLIPARDRLVGVLTGILVMSVIDQNLWPNFAGRAMRRKIGETLRTLAGFTRLLQNQDWAKVPNAGFGVRRNLALALGLYSDWQQERRIRPIEGVPQREPLLHLVHCADELFIALIAIWRYRKLPERRTTLPSAWQERLPQLDAALATRIETASLQLTQSSGGSPAVSAPALPTVDDAPASPAEEMHRELTVLYNEAFRVLVQLEESIAGLAQQSTASENTPSLALTHA